MSDVPIFPAGLYWNRTEVPSIGLREARYGVLWLFPSSAFRYIACWPGYSWFEAAGTWRYGNGLIQCRGKIHSFTDDFSGIHDNRRPYTSAFTPSPDGQALVSIDMTPQHYARLSPQQLGPLFELNEQTVPTRWQGFLTLMLKMEKQIGSLAASGQPDWSASPCQP